MIQIEIKFLVNQINCVNFRFNILENPIFQFNFGIEYIYICTRAWWHCLTSGIIRGVVLMSYSYKKSPCRRRVWQGYSDAQVKWQAIERKKSKIKRSVVALKENVPHRWPLSRDWYNRIAVDIPSWRPTNVQSCPNSSNRRDRWAGYFLHPKMMKAWSFLTSKVGSIWCGNCWHGLNDFPDHQMHHQ